MILEAERKRKAEIKKRKERTSMSINLYVGNLSYGTTDTGLRTAFEAFGEVISAKVILNKETGRSRGFGFVEMADREQGMKALEGLNGQELDGRPLALKEALPREERPVRRPREGGFRPRGPRFE